MKISPQVGTSINESFRIILKVFFRKYCKFQYENTLSIIRDDG